MMKCSYGQPLRASVWRTKLTNLEEKMIKEGRPGQIFVGKNYGYADKVEIETTKSNAPDLSGLSIEEIKKMLDK